MDRHCFDIAGETNIGAGRMKNEDNYCILVPPGFSSGLAVVADGIGGHRDGELASMFCCHGMMKEFLRRGAYGLSYHEGSNKFLKIARYLKKWWPNIVFLEGTDREYIDQILDYTENAEHDDAPDSAACVCRILDKGYH